MLGNVAEMTLSLYHIEYYQGRVGGFVARGGSFITEEGKLRASLRSEQPFYTPNGFPQSRPDLGFRLAIASVIFTNLKTAKELETAWTDYRKGGTGATTSAAISIAPPTTQTSVQLAEAVKIVEGLLQVSTLLPEQKRNLDILRASFGNIEATLKKAEVNDTYAWVHNAVKRADDIYRALKEIPNIQRSIKLIEESGLKEKTNNLKINLENKQSGVEDALNEYANIIKQIDEKEKESIDTALYRYREKFKNEKDVHISEIIDTVKKHIDQYSQQKRSNIKQWRSDLEKLK
jgi:hypothetical protein